MAEQFNKTQLLSDMRDGYAALEALLAPLDEQQLTAATKEGEWSVKDHIAHLATWQRQTFNMLQAVKDNVELPDPTPGMTEEEENDMFYRQNRNLSLQQVQDDFRSSFQQLLEAVQSMTDEQLTRPISWLNDRPIWLWIDGNTYSHYAEHTPWIQEELARVSS